MATALPALARTAQHLRDLGRLTIAVSGGVDSMTLAHLAQRTEGVDARMVHAVSPAVPVDGTARVQAAAATAGWALELVDAGEFDDPRYMANPVNRCYFCKSNLYDAMRACRLARGHGSLASGTNLDDLGDYRPGLEAAAEREVIHPFVTAECTKDDVRAIAAALGLTALSELPSSPCLSSRVETGTAIEPRMLKAIYAAERSVAEHFVPQTVRCRVRAGGRIELELDEGTFHRLAPDERDAASQLVAECFALDSAAAVQIQPYQRGSAFVHGPTSHVGASSPSAPAVRQGTGRGPL